MKQKRFIVTYCALFMAIMPLMVMTGCSGKKSVPEPYKEISDEYEELQKTTKLQNLKNDGIYDYGNTQEEINEYELASPLRFVGQASALDQTFARRYAETDARANAASSIASKVEALTKRYNLGDKKGSADRNTSNSVADEGGTNEGVIREIVNGTVKGATVVKRGFYTKPNGETRVVLCVEIGNNDLQKYCSDLTESVENLISDEDKLKLRYDRQKFCEELEEALRAK